MSFNSTCPDSNASTSSLVIWLPVGSLKSVLGCNPTEDNSRESATITITMIAVTALTVLNWAESGLRKLTLRLNAHTNITLSRISANRR